MKVKRKEWLVLGSMSVPLYGSVICTNCYLCPIFTWICGLSSLQDWSSLIGIAPYRKQNRYFFILSAPRVINCVHLRWLNMCLLNIYSMLGTIHYILEIMSKKRAWHLSSWSLQSGGGTDIQIDHISECLITNCQYCCEGEENSAITAYNKES